MVKQELLCRVVPSNEIHAWSARLRSRVPQAILDVEERVVQIVCNTAEGADAARVPTGPLAGPLLMILGADVPREVPLPEERRDKPSLPRVADTHQKITALLCRSYVLDAQLLERNALRDAARRLQTLVLEDCTLKDGGVKILAEGLSRRLGGRDVCRLLCLSLTNNYIHADGAASLAQAVSVNTTLTELHLDWNPLGPVGVSHLADALRKNKALRSLNLEASDARDTGARSMGAALPLNSTLTTLILDTCNISHEGGTAIADGLRSNQTLASLSLSGNPLGDAGGVALAESLEAGNTSLTRLTVDSSELGLPFFMSIARAMRNGCQLRMLNADRNHAGDEGALTVANALQKVTSLEELHLRDCDISPDAASRLIQIASCVGRLLSLDLGGNKGMGAGELFATRKLHEAARQRHADAQPREAPALPPPPKEDTRSEALRRVTGQARPDSGPPGVWQDRAHTPTMYTLSRTGAVGRGTPPPHPASRDAPRATPYY